VGAATWTAGRASAHAELLEIVPADGEVVQEAPAEVVLRFSEQVSLTGGSARVLDDTAGVVSSAPEVVDTTVVIPLPPGVADGTYTVTFEVISADSHRISGASVFHVRVPSAGGGAVIEPGGDSAGWGVRLGAATLTTVAYAGALLGVGCWWFGLLVVARLGDRAPGVGDRSNALVGRAALLGAVALVAAVPLRIARVGGGLAALRDDDFVVESLRGPIGVSTAVTAGALLVMVALLDIARWPRRGLVSWSAAVIGAIALAGFAIEGHTRSQRPLALMIAFDVVHLAAGAVWLGGIAGLAIAFRARLEPGLLGRTVACFSAVAVVAVVLVVAAGVGMSWMVLPSPSDLVTTGYGRALLVKVLLVATVIVMGAYNRRRLVPAVSAGAGAASEPRRRLGRVVRIELAILLAVVGVTAVLVARSPVSSTAAAPPPVTTPDAVELPLSDGAGTVSFTIAPARAGSNELRLTLLDSGGQPLEPVEDPTVELTEPALELGPLRPLVHPFGGGEYHVIADIPLAGNWELTIRVRVTDFDAAQASTVVEIAP
jgi:copper transport protein